MAKNYLHFNLSLRSKLEAYLRAGWSYRQINSAIGKSIGAISHEIRNNSPDCTRDGYRALLAQAAATRRKFVAAQNNPRKTPAVWQYVETMLRKDWSPDEISQRIKLDYPDDLKMRISSETIYVFVNSASGRTLIKHLRRGTARRSRRKLRLSGGKTMIPGRVSIHDRSRLANRQRFGDWEADLMLGRLKGGVVVAGHVERRSRYLLLGKLADKSAAGMTSLTRKKLAGLDLSLRRTLTLDNGTENVGHEQYGIPVYFCDPYSSWQKGSIENQFGLVRQYLPKGQSLDRLTASELRKIQDKLNHRPKKCLGYKTPFEVLSSHCRRIGVQLPT